jgi:hypothetical protein
MTVMMTIDVSIVPPRPRSWTGPVRGWGPALREASAALSLAASLALAALIECRTSPSAGWARRPPHETIRDPGYEVHCPSTHNQPLGPCSQ